MGGVNRLGKCAEGTLENYCEKSNSLMPFLSYTRSGVQGVGEQKVTVAREKRVLGDLLDLTAMRFLQRLQRMLRLPLHGNYLSSRDHRMSLALKLTALRFVPLNLIVALRRPSYCSS